MTQPDTPSSLSRYRVTSRFEGWSNGETYNAFDPLIERPVVVELFSLTGVAAEDRALITRAFYREMQRVGTLTHPNVASLFDVGETPEGLFATWEHVEGMSLEGFLRGTGPVDAGVWLRWLRQTAGALEYAHLRGILHLNLNPASVLIDPSGDVKVVGFGIAPVVDLLSTARGYQWTRSSHEAPERAATGAATTKADWFSFAAIAREVVRRTLDPEPAAVQVELERALAPDPTARTPSALPLLLAIESELRARGLITSQDEGEEKSGDSVTAVFNHIIAADRVTPLPEPAPDAPAAPAPSVNASVAPPAPPNRVVVRRSHASRWIALAAAALVVAVAGAMVGIWARSPMLADVWNLVGGGADTTPTAAPPTLVPRADVAAATDTDPVAPQAGPIVSPSDKGSAGAVTAPTMNGVLRIVTQPPGAAITVDGESRGVAPLRVDGLSLGGHSISASLSGHAVARQSVQLSSESPARTVGITLSPVTAPMGVLTVSSTPNGAAVTLDGRPAGTTPTQLDLTAGRHKLRVDHAGYASISRDFEVVAGRREALALALEAIPLPAPVQTVMAFERVSVKPRQVAGAESPGFPPVARLSRQSGAVVLSWVVDEQGSVTDIEVVQASAKVFEAAVLGWIRDVKYQPGEHDGKPVRVKMTRRFRFELAR